MLTELKKLAITLLFISPPARAGHLILSVVSEQDGVQCVTSVEKNSSSKGSLYQILLKNEWPTSLGYLNEGHSSEHSV
jgi:hypothetical protein